MDLLSQRVDLAIARARHRFAQSELDRNEKLRAENVVSQFDFETALDNRDALAAEVKEREILVAETEKALAAMKPAAPGNDLVLLETIDQAIKAQEEQFRQSVETLLRSPIDGIVTKVEFFQGITSKLGETTNPAPYLIVMTNLPSEKLLCLLHLLPLYSRWSMQSPGAV